MPRRKNQKLREKKAEIENGLLRILIQFRGLKISELEEQNNKLQEEIDDKANLVDFSKNLSEENDRLAQESAFLTRRLREIEEDVEKNKKRDELYQEVSRRSHGERRSAHEANEATEAFGKRKDSGTQELAELREKLAEAQNNLNEERGRNLHLTNQNADILAVMRRLSEDFAQSEQDLRGSHGRNIMLNGIINNLEEQAEVQNGAINELERQVATQNGQIAGLLNQLREQGMEMARLRNPERPRRMRRQEGQIFNADNFPNQMVERPANAGANAVHEHADDGSNIRR